MMTGTLIDPVVSRKKFDKEVKALLEIRDELRQRGWIIESTSFPVIRVTFLTLKVFPVIAPITVELDLTNYNLMPPSVRFLHPIHFKPILIPALRLRPDRDQPQQLILGHPITNEPFICSPGVKEYHIHPQHTGDSWDLYRYGKETPYYILESIWNYCINGIRAFVFQIHFEPGSIPEGANELTIESNNIEVFLEPQP